MRACLFNDTVTVKVMRLEIEVQQNYRQAARQPNIGGRTYDLRGPCGQSESLGAGYRKRVVAFQPAQGMFIFTKRFPVTPTRNHNHPQLRCITPTVGRVNDVS